MNTINQLADKIAGTQKAKSPLVAKGTVVAVNGDGTVDVSLYGAVIPSRHIVGTWVPTGADINRVVALQRNGADLFVIGPVS